MNQRPYARSLYLDPNYWYSVIEKAHYILHIWPPRRLSSVGGGGASVSVLVCPESIKSQKEVCIIIIGPPPKYWGGIFPPLFFIDNPLPAVHLFLRHCSMNIIRYFITINNVCLKQLKSYACNNGAYNKYTFIPALQ